MKLNGYHKHIDNGGIDVEVHQKEVLRDIGLMFITAPDKIK